MAESNAAHTVIFNRPLAREPFLPSPAHWNQVVDVLCGHCAKESLCRLPQIMMACAKNGGLWPDNAWVTDAGGLGVTCLSYAPVRGEAISDARLDALSHTPEEHLPHVCGGCAARKGSEASIALHTQRDYRAAVQDKSEFTCHEDPENKRLCGGWCRAIQRKEV